MVSYNENLIEVLKNGGVVVMPTDTIYGIVGRAEDISAVEKIYKVRDRNLKKPCTILIASITELGKFSIKITQEQGGGIEKYWPGPVSIILDCLEARFSYLHRGTNTLAFRVPAQKELQELLFKTGPLIAPSANPEGLSPAQSVEEAKKYFGDLVDLYIDGGLVTSKASKVIKLQKDGGVSILRE